MLKFILKIQISKTQGFDICESKLLKHETSDNEIQKAKKQQ